MHNTAFQIGSSFLENYVKHEASVIVEVGSMNVNGSLRAAAPSKAVYIGLDVEHGPGVDLIVKNRAPLPLREGFADIIISTSQMEHDPCFWATFLDLCRITKPGGYIYLNVPSNGMYHAFPVDAWRFYPDAGRALVTWAQDNGYDITLLESFVAVRSEDDWNDFVCVFYLGHWNEGDSIHFLSDTVEATNIWRVGTKVLGKPSIYTEDQKVAYILREGEKDLTRRLSEADKRISILETEILRLTTALSDQGGISKNVVGQEMS